MATELDFTLLLPSPQIGAVIGKGGNHISETRSSSGEWNYSSCGMHVCMYISEKVWEYVWVGELSRGQLAALCLMRLCSAPLPELRYGNARTHTRDCATESPPY